MSRYLALQAKDNRELGHQLGEIFRERLAHKIERAKHPAWDREVRQALRHWKQVERHFPRLCEETRAYARAAHVRWQDLWTVGLESNVDTDRCTAMVTNRGALVGHVEDFEPGTAHDLFLIRKTVGGLTVLDFNYFYTLGGNAASANAHGWCQLINTVHGPVRHDGIPRNVIARWLSETADPVKDARLLERLPRMNGYSHTFVHADGRAFNLEVMSSGVSLREVRAPFVHTNHYLSALQEEECMVSGSSSNRFEAASRALKARMGVDALKALMSDRSRGRENSIFNEDTVGKLVIDLKRREAQAWFRAAPRKGYLTVPLDFLPS